VIALRFAGKCAGCLAGLARGDRALRSPAGLLYGSACGCATRNRSVKSVGVWYSKSARRLEAPAE
jgi:hypothetical protein